MSNELVFNHHSLPFVDQESAQEGILTFLKTLWQSRKYGLKILLLDNDQDASLMRVKLAENYYVSDWFNQAKNDPLISDWARALRSLETQKPLFTQGTSNDVCDCIEVGLPEIKHGYPVLTVAYERDTFLVSFVSSERWKAPIISVWVLDLRNEDVNEFNHEIVNLFDDASLTIHEEKLVSRRNFLQNTPKNMWNNRATLFPNLILLDDSIGTVFKTWSYPFDILEKTKNALAILEEFALKWKEGHFPDYQHEHLITLGLQAQVSGESSSVHNTPKKREEREFRLSDERKEFCENHIKLPRGYRLHFFPDSQEKCIYVAYIGPHLLL